MIVKTRFPEQVYSGTPQELVQQLRAISHSPTKTDHEFMKQVSERMVLQVGRSIKIDSPENFITGLIEAGMLTEEDKK